MMNNPIRVFIVDDHPLVREGLAAKIEREPEFTLCGEAGDVATTLAMLPGILPDIILVDISLPTSSGLSLIKTVHRHYPQIKQLVISMHEESVYGPRTRRAGADGYVSKDRAAEVMIEAMQTVVAGGQYFDESVPDFESETTPLTPREFQVFEMIGQGLTIAPIAEALNVSGKTIEAHRENIKLKLGLETSHDLTVYATRWFAFPPPSETTVPG
jgi:DNA-binding NarL/FixJ family response regulator